MLLQLGAAHVPQACESWVSLILDVVLKPQINRQLSPFFITYHVFTIKNIVFLLPKTKIYIFYYMPK